MNTVRIDLPRSLHSAQAPKPNPFIHPKQVFGESSCLARILVLVLGALVLRPSVGRA